MFAYPLSRWICRIKNIFNLWWMWRMGNNTQIPGRGKKEKHQHINSIQNCHQNNSITTVVPQKIVQKFPNNKDTKYCNENNNQEHHENQRPNIRSKYESSTKKKIMIWCDNKVNLYNKGIITNFNVFFCENIKPSQNNFREKVQQEAFV